MTVLWFYNCVNRGFTVFSISPVLQFLSLSLCEEAEGQFLLNITIQCSYTVCTWQESYPPRLTPSNFS